MAERFFTPEEMQRELAEFESRLEKQRAERESASEQERLQQQIERDRAIKERKEREREEDKRKEYWETRKLQRELKEGPKQKRDRMTDKPKVPSKIEQERKQVEDFMEKAKQQGLSGVVRKEEIPTAQETTPVQKEVPSAEPKQPISQREEKPHKLTQRQQRQLKKYKKHLKEQEEKKNIKPDPKRHKQIGPALTQLGKKLESLDKKRERMLEKDNKDAAVEIEGQMHDIERKMRELKLWANNSDYPLSSELKRLMWKPSAEEKALLENPEYVQQGQSRCLTEGHGDRPAVMRLKHHETLGEGMPDLTFCEDCAMKFKMLPIMENDPSNALLKKLNAIANKLDAKGLYKEADIIDRILVLATQTDHADLLNMLLKAKNVLANFDLKPSPPIIFNNRVVVVSFPLNDQSLTYTLNAGLKESGFAHGGETLGSVEYDFKGELNGIIWTRYKDNNFDILIGLDNKYRNEENLHTLQNVVDSVF